MAPAPNPGPSVITVAARGAAAIGIWRLLAVAMPHLAALIIMVRTETDFGSRAGFLLSKFKHDVVQMTANFIDLMVIDRDTVAFLFTIFPNLRWSVISAGLVTIPLMYALWWLDPFRIRRLPALAGMLACLAALVGYAITWPDEAWRGYYDDGYFSKFARSGVNAVSDFINYGFMESA